MHKMTLSPVLRSSGRGEASPGFIVRDPAMKEVCELAAGVAPGKIPVLIVGETGSGKERVAEILHAQSGRADAPFIQLNCAALTETLFESELFGHERGAFTGAAQPKSGLFEAAGPGTVFLDEIGELPLGQQAKLLRALETKSVRRVGGVDERPIHARFVAATNRDLEAEVERGNFRSDLFYRIAGVVLRVPPLRDRTLEIIPLAQRFVAESCRELARPTVLLSDEACALLLAQRWRGNIRELRNVIERAVLLARGAVIEAKDLQIDPTREAVAAVAPPGESAAVRSGCQVGDAGLKSEPTEHSRSSLARDEKLETVRAALSACGGNQARAAENLGISRRTLGRWLDRMALPRPRKLTPVLVPEASAEPNAEESAMAQVHAPPIAPGGG
jgi:DNA-binding NtrC family response regulator